MAHEQRWRRTALVVCLVLVNSLPARTLTDTFDPGQPGFGWLLDERWRLADGALWATGEPGQVLAVGCRAAPAGDFTATLTTRLTVPEAADDTRAYGYGLLYHMAADAPNGQFLLLTHTGAYAFGHVEAGAFVARQQGASDLLRAAGLLTISLEVVGDRHVLRSGGTLIDAWRDDRHTDGAFGLLVLDAAEVAFEELALTWPETEAEADADAGTDPATVEPAAQEPAEPPLVAPEPAPAVEATVEPEPEPDQLPTEPAPLPTEPEPEPEPPVPPIDADGLAFVHDWRERSNTMAVGWGDPMLPLPLDPADVVVAALLLHHGRTGVLPPATLPAELLTASTTDVPPALARLVVTFWLDHVVAEARRDGGADDSWQERVARGLSRYETMRRRLMTQPPTTAAPDLDERVTADEARYRHAVPAAERARQDTALAVLREALAVYLAAWSGRAR